MFKSIIGKVKQTPKSLKALVIVLVAIAFPAMNMVQAANNVLMEGSTSVLNVSAGETEYKKSTSMKVDEVVQVQVWQHNRELPGGEQAHNTRVKVDLKSEGTVQTITGKTTLDNGNSITDSAVVNLSTERAKLKYQTATAKYKYNKGAADGDQSCITGMNYPPERCFTTVTVSDDIFNGGADGKGVNLDAYRKGTQQPNGGPLNGCNAFHETVTVQFRSMADVISVRKYVRHQGQDSSAWKTSTVVKPGDQIEYMIEYKNEGNTQLNNVIVGDNMPKYNKYDDTKPTMLKNGANPNGIDTKSHNITKGGINVGNYLPGAVGYVWFSAKIDPISAYEKCGPYDVRNVGIVRSETIGTNEFYNTAQVLIQVDCKDQPVAKYSCDLLKVTKGEGRKASYTVNATATGGATIKNYVYTFGDGQSITTDKSTVEHTYAKDGQYATRVKVNFALNNQTVSAEGDQCAAVVTYTTPDTPKTPGTPIGTPPTTLPNTGAGDVVAIFLVVTAVSTGAYYLVARRAARF